MPKEALARIKINRLLEEAGWRFFYTSEGKANIVLEPSVILPIYYLTNMMTLSSI
jgi:type I restriction enzyme R subunit